MNEERLIDAWSRLEVEWREALEHAIARQHEYDTHMTNHLVYHFAAPDLSQLNEIRELWQTAAEKRRSADAFIQEHHRKT